VGFFATSGYTMFVATLRALCGMRRRWPPWPFSSKTRSRARLGRIETATLDLLHTLCDLQAVTGLAIATSGLVQLPEISYYHEQFVVNFWELTLISFFAARPRYMQSDSEGPRAFVRKFTVFTSTVLYLVFAGFVLERENSSWDNLDSGHCYLSNDITGRDTTIFWISGTSVYAIALAIDLVQDVLRYTHDIQDFLVPANKFIKSIPYRVWRKFEHEQFVIKLVGVFLSAFLWLIINCLTVWAYGTAFYPFELVCYYGLVIWTSWSTLDLKHANRGLIDGHETEWKFGQVLPVAMLIFIISGTVDAWRSQSPYPGSSKGM
jgi:hypothetical protein